jgi:hypothetical protein
MNPPFDDDPALAASVPMSCRLASNASLRKVPPSLFTACVYDDSDSDGGITVARGSA